MENLLSVGKILNFHGISGIAKVGYSNSEIMKNLKNVLIGEKPSSCEAFTVEKVNFHKNFCLIKFKEINSINELLPYKGQNIYIKKDEAKKSLDSEEFLIEDLIGMNVFDNEEEHFGVVVDVKSSSGNDILCIKPLNPAKGEVLVPFAKELVPIVDVEKKRIIIKPIEGLLE